MKIRTKLLLSAAASIGLVIVLGVVVLFSDRQVDDAIAKNQTASHIRERVSELNVLASEYLVHGGERTRTQWYLVRDDLADLLAPDEFASMMENLETLEATFAQLVASREAQQVNGFEPSATHTPVEDRLAAQLSLRSQSITSEAVRLADATRADIAGVEERTTVLTLVFVGALLAIVIGTGVAVSLSIGNPIKRLTRAAEDIAKGNLNTRAEGIGGKDEIGILGSAFNLMAARLKETNDSLEQRVTERTAAAEERAQQLARSNGELDDFTYVVSHDLKEPLRGIEAFSTFLTEDYADKLDEQGQKYVGVLRDSAMRMNALIEDLLVLSRIGRTDQTYAPVSVQSLLEDIRQDLAFTLEEKKVDLRIQSGLPTITYQPVHLRQVFQNLISNAIKFNDKPQPVVEIACHEDDSLYTFSVRDNGIGIDEKYYEKIFQIFQRLGRREDYEGTGAGLTICKKIVEAHAGKIWLESKVGGGSIFSFTIPKSIRPDQGQKEEGK